VKSLTVEEKLAVDKFDVDKEPHIKVKSDLCRSCEKHPCIFACPAGCFKAGGEGVTFSYEGCLECGSCRVVCDKGAIDWSYPRPGFGICYEFG
jgi:ferredoxin like protein